MDVSGAIPVLLHYDKDELPLFDSVHRGLHVQTRHRAVNKYGLEHNGVTDAIVWTFSGRGRRSLLIFSAKQCCLLQRSSFAGFFPAELSSSGGILCGGLAGIQVIQGKDQVERFR